jgi:RNA polymerase subunit RPABC4/transcription elongation factor Spt4
MTKACILKRKQYYCSNCDLWFSSKINQCPACGRKNRYKKKLGDKVNVK